MNKLITIKEYSTPKCIDEAYNLLLEKRNNVLFGGGAFIRMGSKNIFTAILVFFQNGGRFFMDQ